MIPIVVLTGMHRSGTSLFANYLTQLGIDFGHSLMPADHGNPLGYFEHLDFFDFHNQLLDQNQLSYFFTSRPKIKLAHQDFISAKNLIKKNTKGRKNFGWKDPRTSIFLNLWAELIGEKSYYIFLYREPVKVMESLLRRNTDPIIQSNPHLALKNWTVYNSCIMDFIKDRSIDSYLLLNIDSFLVDFESNNKLVRSFLSFIDRSIDVNVENFFKPDHFSVSPKKSVHVKSFLKKILVYKELIKAQKLYAELKNYSHNENTAH